MARHHPDLIMCRKQPGIGKPCSFDLTPSFRILHTFLTHPLAFFFFSRSLSTPAIGRLCEKCDGKCVICDSYVRPQQLVRVCEECNYGSMQGRCVICGGAGVSDAYYCKECVTTEKDVSLLEA